jgi:hypothetical protein
MNYGYQGSIAVNSFFDLLIRGGEPMGGQKSLKQKENQGGKALSASGQTLQAIGNGLSRGLNLLKKEFSEMDEQTKSK